MQADLKMPFALLVLGTLGFIGCSRDDAPAENRSAPPSEQSGNPDSASPPVRDSANASAGTSLDLSYITADFSSAVVIHPARLLNSDFNQGLEDSGAPVLKGFENGLRLSGVDPRTVEQVILLGDDSAASSAGSMIPGMLGFGGPPQQPSRETQPELREDKIPDKAFDGEPASPNQGALSLVAAA